MVTAMPVTGVSGLPALKVSTVSLCQGTPTCCWMRATTSRAVRRSSRANAVLVNTAMVVKATVVDLMRFTMDIRPPADRP